MEYAMLNAGYILCDILYLYPHLEEIIHISVRELVILVSLFSYALNRLSLDKITLMIVYVVSGYINI